MKKPFRSALFLLILPLSTPAFAEDPAEPSANTLPASVFPEVVVTANRLQQPASQVASSVEVITAADIKRRQAGTVLEALRDLPGLDVVLSGQPGNLSSAFLRGADSSHTLVLLDGIPLNDPISTARLYENLDLISTEDVERVEVVRGPQSPLFGSNAMGGVVQIISKKGEGGPKGSLLFEGGAYSTFREAISFTQGDREGKVSLSLSRFDTAGFSAAAVGGSGESLADGHRNTTASIRMGAGTPSGWEGSLFLRYNESFTDLDDGGGAGAEDPDYHVKGRQWAVQGSSRALLLDGQWEALVTASYSSAHRALFDDPNDVGDIYGFSRNTFQGDTAQLEWQNNFPLAKEETLVVGLSGRKEWGRSSSDYGFGPSLLAASAETGGVFLESWTSLEGGVFLSLGGRLDAYTSFGTHFTWKAGAAWLVPGTGTKLKATYGTGFKTPSLYQLYSSYGDVGLNPEESTGWDAGVEQAFLDGKMQASATYFRNGFANLIDYWNDDEYWNDYYDDFILNSSDGVDDSGYYNLNRAQTEGVEISLSSTPLSGLAGRIHYTYTDARNKVTEEALLRRPWHKAGAEVSYQEGPANFGLSLSYVGERKDLDYPVVINLPSHFLVGLRASWRLDETLRLFGRLQNLLDVRYQEVFGYGSPGRSAYAGIQMSL